jgi:hypothetical protein
MRLLIVNGADPPGSDDPEDLSQWLRVWKARLCHPLRHRGNHKYAWRLNHRVPLPPGRPYPKQVDG